MVRDKEPISDQSDRKIAVEYYGHFGGNYIQQLFIPVS